MFALWPALPEALEFADPDTEAPVLLCAAIPELPAAGVMSASVRARLSGRELSSASELDPAAAAESCCDFRGAGNAGLTGAAYLTSSMDTLTISTPVVEGFAAALLRQATGGPDSAPASR
jgi:hypothetical protein